MKGFEFVPQLPTFHYLMISLFISVNSIIGEYVEHFFVKGVMNPKDGTSSYQNTFGFFERVIFP
jgi:hypothetical protein